MLSLMSIVANNFVQVTVQFDGYVNEEYVFDNGYTLPPNVNLTSFSKYFNLKLLFYLANYMGIKIVCNMVDLERLSWR